MARLEPEHVQKNKQTSIESIRHQMSLRHCLTSGVTLTLMYTFGRFYGRRTLLNNLQASKEKLFSITARLGPRRNFNRLNPTSFSLLFRQAFRGEEKHTNGGKKQQTQHKNEVSCDVNRSRHFQRTLCAWSLVKKGKT